MDQQMKYCKSCKLSQRVKEFLKTVRRKDYSLYSDSDGVTLYLVELKTCKSCRTKNIYYKNVDITRN